MGQPYHLDVDQGSAYISDEMQQNVAASTIQLTAAPVENPGTIGIVERTHAPLRATYDHIQMDVGYETNADDCLAIVVHAVNSTVGP